ncbi:MAG: glycosyltransferase family 4 protein [Candidatus Omnitrophota bacterium]
MNILILTTHFNPGGISRYVLNLSQALRRQKHNVWVACSGGEWVQKLNSSGVDYKQIPIKTKSICSIKILLSFRALAKLITQEKIDLVHCNTRVTQFLGFLISKRFKIPYISAYHGFYRPSIFRRWLKFSGTIAIAVSEAVAEHLVRDLGIAREKIKVVYNGINPDDFLIKEAKRSDWGFSKDDYLIGILSRISAEKGHFLAAEAIAKLKLKYQNIYLLVSGKGKRENQLKEYLKKAGIERRVKFINCQPNQFFDIIDLLLVPSRKEGFGYSIIEAFIKEVPVIGYNTGGIAEIIKDRENGILFYHYNSFTLAGAIEEIIVNPKLAREIVNQAKKDVGYFSADRMVIDTEKIYQELC